MFSDETFAELRSQFHRRKFDAYVGRKVRAVWLAQLQAVSEWVSIAGAKLGCRDPDDDKLLETALMGQAECLVTGDRDLLVMSPFHGVPILTPFDHTVEPSLRGEPTREMWYELLDVRI